MDRISFTSRVSGNIGNIDKFMPTQIDDVLDAANLLLKNKRNDEVFMDARDSYALSLKVQKPTGVFVDKVVVDPRIFDLKKAKAKQESMFRSRLGEIPEQIQEQIDDSYQMKLEEINRTKFDFKAAIIKVYNSIYNTNA